MIETGKAIPKSILGMPLALSGGTDAKLADFFDRQSITIESLHCSRYRAMQTGAEMFTAQVTIGIPADMHIAALRDDFLEFCDHLNLDAIMDPMKF